MPIMSSFNEVVDGQFPANEWEILGLHETCKALEPDSTVGRIALRLYRLEKDSMQDHTQEILLEALEFQEAAQEAGMDFVASIGRTVYPEHEKGLRTWIFFRMYSEIGANLFNDRHYGPSRWNNFQLLSYEDCVHKAVKEVRRAIYWMENPDPYDLEGEYPSANSAQAERLRRLVSALNAAYIRDKGKQFKAILEMPPQDYRKGSLKQFI